MNVKNIVGFAIGPVGSAILGLATTPLIAWAFSPEDVGRFGVFQTVLSLVLVVSVFGLDQAYTREYHSESDKPRLFKNSVIPGLCLLVILSVGVIFYGKLISEFLFGIESRVLISLTVCAVTLNYFTRFLSLILRMQERGLAFSMSQVIPKFVLLAIILVYIALPFEKSLVHLFYAFVASMAVVLVIFGWNTRKELKESFKASLDSDLMRKLFRYGLPLVVAGLAFQAISAVTIFSLRTLSTFPELAVYSVTLRFSAVAVLVQSIFSIIWAPLVFKWHSNNVDMNRVNSVAPGRPCGCMYICRNMWLACLAFGLRPSCRLPTGKVPARVCNGTTAFIHPVDSNKRWHRVAEKDFFILGYLSDSASGEPSTLLVVNSPTGCLGSSNCKYSILLLAVCPQHRSISVYLERFSESEDVFLPRIGRQWIDPYGNSGA